MTPTDSGLIIRVANADDAAGMAALLDQLGFSTSASDVVHRLDVFCGTALVAERGAQVVGLVTTALTTVLHRPTAVGRISALVVTEAERSRGVGRRLVEAAEKLLASQGCALVEVTSNHRLEQARAFYRHLGYEATSIRFKKEI